MRPDRDQGIDFLDAENYRDSFDVAVVTAS